MEYQVSPLRYPCSALEPHLDAETVLIHHGQYYGSCVRELNRILSLHPELRGNSVQQLLVHLAGVPESFREAVRYHAGGCLNHEIFFSLLRPRTGRKPAGALAEAIRTSFRDFETFRRKFEDSAMNLFGSGWVWLVCSGVPTLGSKPDLTVSAISRLRILTTHNNENPLSLGLYPILGLDLWEHAYHHRFRNDRRAYLNAWWQVIDWEAVEQRYLPKDTFTARTEPHFVPYASGADLPIFRLII
jgi:Fe-Mn family superoxide dismutase